MDDKELPEVKPEVVKTDIKPAKTGHSGGHKGIWTHKHSIKANKARKAAKTSRRINRGK